MYDGRFTLKKERIDTIDVLRGFALGGILYAHMIIWYTGAALPADIYAKYSSAADGIAMGIFGGIVFGKFFSVFSFLFGLSFYLHFRKREFNSGFPGIYLWRLFLLFLIGLAHHTFWRGDILAIYAVLGVVLLFFKNLPSHIILIISILLIFNLPVHIFDLVISKPENPNIGLPMEAEGKHYYELIQNADFLTVLKENWLSWPSKLKYQMESGRLTMTLGFFLLGFYTGRIRLFTRIKRNLSKLMSWNKITGRIALFLLFTGWIMYINDIVTLPEIKILPEFKWALGFLFDIYNACVTVFFITGISLLLRINVWKNLLIHLASMGRMALTNYLLQTVFGLLLFYNFGLGLFDETSLGFNMVFVVIAFSLQLKFSQWWLNRYSQGPVEWVWRSLTYFKISPIKHTIKQPKHVSVE